MSRVLRVAVLDDYQGAVERYFDTAALRDLVEPEVTIYRDRAGSEDELVRRAGAAEVVVCMRERSAFPRAVIEQLAATKLIVTTGPLNAAIDLPAAAQRGIVVSSTHGYDSSPAELTWALILGVIRRIPQEDAAVRAGAWGVHVGDTLDHRTLGVIGLGHLGGRVARIGRAFGMRVLAWSRNLTPERAALYGCEAVDLDTLLRESDIVTLHLKLNQETHHRIGCRELGLMKPTAHLVNTARGALVDEAALVQALDSGKIAGAGLDVFEREPLPPGHPLLAMTNVVLTPHIGYVTHYRYSGFFTAAVENIRYYLLDTPIRVLTPDTR